MEHLEPGSLKIREWGLVAEGTSFSRVFRKGQVLFGKRRAYQRKVAVADFDGICSSDILVFEPKGEELIPELLPFIVQSDGFFSHALGTSAGSLSPRTRWSQLAQYEFPLPPKDEQRRVAEILWAAEVLSDAYRDLALSASRARQILIDHVVPEKGDKRLGSKVVKLGDVCRMQNGRPFPSRDYTDQGVRLVRPGNLAGDGTFDWKQEATTYMPQSYGVRNRNHMVGPGDIVMNLTAQSLEDAFIGRVCLAGPKDSGLLNQRLGRFFFDDAVLPEYAFRCMQTQRFRRLVESRCEGSKIRHIYFRHFADLPLVLLPIKEQEKVVKTIRQTESAERNAQRTHLRFKDAKSALRESLMTA